MRYAILGPAIVMAAFGMSFSQAAEAAVKYPYCIEGSDSIGCWYKTLAQCRESAADTGRDCIVNPKLDLANRAKAMQAFD